MTSGKPAASAIAAAAIITAAGPESAVFAGVRRARSVDITPPLDWMMWKRPSNATSSSAPSSLAR